MDRSLTAEQWTQVQQAFDELVVLSPTSRIARLAAGGLSQRLENEVRSLLAAADQSGFLDQGLQMLDGAEPGPYSSLPIDATVGVFRIDGLVGRGGAGEVYRAHRDDPAFEQVVAIKVLRPEAVDRIGPFEAERKLLSTLEHPGIARLIDGGLTGDGRAFMAMEYVDGLDIITWCRTNSPKLEARLALFNQVCEAVAYAHRRLIVHRDIKPSNILIDVEGRVRMLDFGVARLLEAGSVGQTGTLLILTPQYAAPEQLENRPTTTAADVYGLGAVLFELLTGRSAWDGDNAPMPVVLRRLLHDDSPVPSRTAATFADAPVSARRLSGDLDAIVLKAMRRNPSERYESVAAMAEDVRRHLTSQPVQARDGAGLYIAQRFVRRHRWGVGATVAGLVAVLVGSGGIAWQARATAVERDVARAEAARAEAVNQTVSLMFRSASETGRGGSATAKELLDSSAQTLLNRIDPRNADQAAVVITLGELYAEIGDDEAMDSLVSRALAKGVGANDPVVSARLKLLLASAKASTSDLPQARRLLAEAQAVWARDPARFRQQIQEGVSVEAAILRQSGDSDAGIKLLLDNVDAMYAAYAPGSRDVFIRVNNLAVHLIEANRLDEADGVLTRGEVSLKAAGAGHTSIGLMLLNTRSLYWARRQDFAQAARISKQALDLRRDLYGPSTLLASDLANYARFLSNLQRWDEAVASYAEAQPMAEQYSGANSMAVFAIALGRVDVLCGMHRREAAEAPLADLQRISAGYGPNSMQHALFVRARGFVRIEEKRFSEARSDLDQAEAYYKAMGPAGAPYIADVRTLRTLLPK